MCLLDFGEGALGLFLILGLEVVNMRLAVEVRADLFISFNEAVEFLVKLQAITLPYRNVL